MVLTLISLRPDVIELTILKDFRITIEQPELTRILAKTHDMEILRRVQKSAVKRKVLWCTKKQ